MGGDVKDEGERLKRLKAEGYKSLRSSFIYMRGFVCKYLVSV